jgi:hypothetical protein
VSLGMIHLDFVYICCTYYMYSVMASLLALLAWNATAVSTTLLERSILLVCYCGSEHSTLERIARESKVSELSKRVVYIAVLFFVSHIFYAGRRVI